MRKSKSNLVRPLAPEEVRPGSYVVVLHEISQFLPWSFDEAPRLAEPVSIRMLPDDPEPLEVLSVCMPFVFAKKPDDALVTLDVRRHLLGLLDKAALRRVLSHLGKKRGGQPQDPKQPKN